MGDLAARIRAKFKRRHSNVPSLPSTASVGSHTSGLFRLRPRSLHNVNPLSGKSRAGSSRGSVADENNQQHDDDQQPALDADPGPDPDADADCVKGEAPDQVSVEEDNGEINEDACSQSFITTSFSTATVDQTLDEHSSSPTTGTTTTDTGTTALTALTPTHSAGQDQPRSPTNDMAGNDLRSSTGKLSSINEHPAQDLHRKVAADPSDATVELPRTSTSEEEQHASSDSDRKGTAVKKPPHLSLPLAPPTLRSPRPRPGNLPIPKTAAATSSRPTTPTLINSPSNTPASPLLLRALSTGPRPPAPQRRQSLLSNEQSSLISTLLGGSRADDAGAANSNQLLPISGNMVTRKIWVKRPGGSATLVMINEDDVVDDVRDMILRKYTNSLGRQFDAPDLTLRIKPREQLQERTLGPEEPMGRTLDAYFPGGQTVDEALIIDVPLRRTPRASPRTGPPHAPHIQSVYYGDDLRPSEAGNDYFGPGALAAAHLPVTVTGPSTSSAHSHAMTVLSTGQIPQIPSPGGARSRPYRDRPDRPRLGRQHTSSPTILNMVGGTHPGSAASTANHEQATNIPAPPPLPTPPAADANAIPQRIATPPPARVSSPRPTGGIRAKKTKKNADHPSLPKGMLNGSVPPINVLIVEDNIINLKLLEAFVKRLKVRWNTAMNGRDAVNKWREGGFHLVLMDIQLPVMSGLDATREIRRLERVNSIGVFSSAANTAPEIRAEPSNEDKLANTDLFKSPVIIVALTASSLQSDRHEALAAGCNDFLTKPVNFVWLERKVMEWGCMQALIDFDGWRKWKDFSQKAEEDKAAVAAAKSAAAQKAKTKKNRSSLTAVSTAA